LEGERVQKINISFVSCSYLTIKYSLISLEQTKADEATLKSFFETFGPVTECKIIMDKTTGNSKG